jgi:hypothetical protein
MPVFCSLVGLLDVSQASLELASGGTGALLFFQCNVAWRSFVWAGVQDVEALIPVGAFFLPSVALASQQIFDLWSSCCLLLHSSCHLGSPHKLMFCCVGFKEFL